MAIELKTKGNKAYVDRKFEDAVKYYTRAIEVSPEEDPVFYSNRAASKKIYNYGGFSLVLKCFRLHVLPNTRV